MTAKIVGLFISNGGVPKLPVARGFVSALGLEGDKQRNLKYHGGVERALCLYSHEVIVQLQNEGHPIAPGTTGENVLIAGLDWSLVKTGAQLKLGEVVVEVTRPTTPCKNIVASFKDGDFMRIHHKKAPHDSRVYVRVLETGDLHVGDDATLLNEP
ncbi:MAG TPA: MOSC domain-containing protein [Abditibacteriaceae bacterium]|jgi:MOSC domain-containing protein YiiM|nr:MOSC domain-containing protein [Abditibacteriaceae bacterium]